MGRGRPRGHAAHVLRPGPAHRGRPRRLPGRAPGRPLPGLPPGRARPSCPARTGPRDGLVEIWNGMPFLSPLWNRGPRVVFSTTSTPRCGRWCSATKAGQRSASCSSARWRRRSTAAAAIVTLSESSKHDIVEQLGFRDRRASTSCRPASTPASPPAPTSPVARPARRRRRPAGAGQALRPAGAGRAEARRRVPDLELVIVGDGYERPRSRPSSTSSTPTTGSASRLPHRRTSSSTSTAGRGSSPRPRPARAGA